MRASGQFYFFYEKISHAQKAQKAHISEQKLKKHLKRRKSLIRLFAFMLFMCTKKTVLLCA